MKHRVMLVGFAAALGVYGAALAVDQPIPAKVGLIKPAKLAKFVSKGDGFPLPVGPGQDPTINGAEINIFDTIFGVGGSFTHSLDKTGWVGLGNPPGAKGFKYKGSKASPVDSTCTIVLIKSKVIKAVCKGGGVTLTTPFGGDVGIILGIPAGSAALRYCADLGGTEKKNNNTGLKRKDALAPASCPFVLPTPTATATGTVTDTRTVTNTPTVTNTATVTNTPVDTATVTPTPTATVPVCPLSPGTYTITQTAGGTLSVYGFAPFAFPSGGMIVEDVHAASLPACVHDLVVPFPGGFNAPNFCVPALNLITNVSQTGCGIGKLDSNGGSDFDTLEVADTSDSLSGICTLPHPACASGANSSIRVDITVGDTVADSCGSIVGGMNTLVTVPVHTKSWHDNSGGTFCPSCSPPCSGNGVFDPGDTVIAEFDQILDFTTALGQGHWSDLDGDGCSLAGLGPAGGYSATGTCIDPSKVNTASPAVTTVATGEFGSTGGTFDGSFSTTLPNTVSGPAAPSGATCGSPPLINYSGLAHRCIP